MNKWGENKMTQINDFEVTSRIQQASAASKMFRPETLNCSKMIQDTISHTADRISACPSKIWEPLTFQL